MAFLAELNEVLTREFAGDGYSGVEVRVTPMRSEVVIRPLEHIMFSVRRDEGLGNLLLWFRKDSIFLRSPLSFMLRKSTIEVSVLLLRLNPFIANFLEDLHCEGLAMVF